MIHWRKHVCVFLPPSAPLPPKAPESQIQTLVPIVPPPCITFLTPWVMPLTISEVYPPPPSRRTALFYVLFKVFFICNWINKHTNTTIRLAKLTTPVFVACDAFSCNCISQTYHISIFCTLERCAIHNNFPWWSMRGGLSVVPESLQILALTCLLTEPKPNLSGE